MTTDKRLPVLDLAKSLSVIYMFFVHVYEVGAFDGDLIVAGAIPAFLGNVIEFFGSIPSAGIFVLIMGFLVGWSASKTPKKLLKESLVLVILGFLVNVFEHLLPVLLEGCSPEEFLEVLPAILAIDIYYFDAMALACLAVILSLPKEKRVKAAIGMMVLSLLLAHVLNLFVSPTGLVWLDTALGLFIRLNEYSYFPLLNWLPFVLLGYVNAGVYLEKRSKNIPFTVRHRLASVALGLLLTFGSYRLMKQYGISDSVCFASTCVEDDYYNLLGLNVLEAVGVIILLMNFYEGVCYLTKNRLPKILTEISANIMDIYVFQWLLIGLSYALIARTTNVYSNMLLALIIFILSIALASAKKYLYRRYKARNT